jgi:uracil phosphoribosyltransferase
MIATGGTACAAVAALHQWNPRMRIKVLSVVGSEEGVQYLLHQHPSVQIYLAAVDRTLNDRGFIVPGLGDAGNRLFRTK